MVGAKSEMLTRRCASSSEAGAGERSPLAGAGRCVRERGDDPRGTFGALSKCPGPIALHGSPQRAVTRCAGPSTQRRPSLWAAHAAARMRARARAHRGVGQHRAAPQPQRHRDRGRAVADVGQLAPRPHDHHCAARLAPVPPLQKRADLTWRLRRRVRRTPSLSRAESVPVQRHLARRCRRHPAAWAPRRTARIDPRRRLLPRLDVEIEVDDMTLVLGVVVQLLLRRGLGRAVR